MPVLLITFWFCVYYWGICAYYAITLFARRCTFKAGLPTRATCAAWTFTTTSDYFQNIRRTCFNISHYWVELAILHLPTPIQWIDVYVT